MITLISSEVGSTFQSWCADPMHHCSVSEDRKIETIPVEGHQLWTKLGNLVDEAHDKITLGSLASKKAA